MGNIGKPLRRITVVPTRAPVQAPEGPRRAEPLRPDRSEPKQPAREPQSEPSRP